MSSLSRLTTEYIEAEDRIRVTGELPALAGEDSPRTVVLWLTQRLLNRLLPHLLQWLERHDVPQGWDEVVQGFAQQAAVAALPAQAPVRSAPESRAWLVQSLQLTCTPESVQLGFQAAAAEDAPPADLVLQAQALRQWLNIVYDQYVRASWPLALWPQWLIEARQPVPARPAALLH